MNYRKLVLLVGLWLWAFNAYSQDDIYTTPSANKVSKQQSSFFELTKGRSKLLLLQRTAIDLTVFEYDQTAYNLGFSFQKQTNYASYFGLEYRFSDRFALQVEIGGNTLSSKYSYKIRTDTVTGIPIIKTDISAAKYITVPITGKFRLYDLEEEAFTIYLLPSAYFGFFQSGYTKYNVSPDMDPDVFVELDESKGFTKRTLSGAIGLELNARILPYLYLTAQGRYISSFTDINDGFFLVRSGTSSNTFTVPILAYTTQFSAGLQVRLW
jgi:hypothetical protein